MKWLPRSLFFATMTAWAGAACSGSHSGDDDAAGGAGNNGSGAKAGTAGSSAAQGGSVASGDGGAGGNGATSNGGVAGNSTTANGGASAQGGSSAGASSGAASGKGTGGTPSGSGGDGPAGAGESSGGEAGGGTAGGAAAGGSTNGAGPIPVIGLGLRCSTERALACNGHAQKTRLVCQRGEWANNGTCTADENCDSATGLCATLVLPCRNLQPGMLACFTTERGRCGPDLVTVEERVTCSGTVCRASKLGAYCAPPYCGDGRTQAPEDCDDANSDDNDGCNTACHFPSCGDGFVEKNEDCDDANHDDTDDCTNACKFATCGDGIVHAGVEECDDGNQNNEDGCTTRCAPPRCGDGFIRPSEPCDDGNTDDGDGCSSTCTLAWPVESAAGNYTCARMNDGSVRCWGQNDYGELGQGDTDPIAVPPGKALNFGKGRTALRLASGSSHVCALLDDGSLKCWGYNIYGQLGLGNVGDQHVPAVNPIDFGGRTVLAVSGGVAHTCALLDDGALECWGNNEHGQLGLGTTTPTALKTPTDPVDLGPGRYATAVSAGYAHTCALLDDGSVECWGDNEFSAVGTGTTGEQAVLAPTTVDLGAGRSAQALFGGSVSHASCALLDDDSLVCWGSNFDGMLGTGDTHSSVPYPVAVDLGSGRRARSVSMGLYHTCALLDDGSVKCWGFNNHGQLGLGAATNHLTTPPATPIDLGTGRTATQIASGLYHSCAVLDDDTLKCWGFNMFGQLGLGDALDRGLAPGEMGDDLPAIVVWHPPPN